jgi:hypothetical protein
MCFGAVRGFAVVVKHEYIGEGVAADPERRPA